MRELQRTLVALSLLCICLPLVSVLAQGDDPVTCQVTSLQNQNVNLRAGPSTDDSMAGVLAAGQSAEVDGQTTGSDGFVWWHLADGAWVRSDVVRETGDCARVPANGQALDSQATRQPATTGEVTLTLVNDSRDVFCVVVAVPQGSMGRRGDWLVFNLIVGRGQSAVLGIEPGIYSVELYDCFANGLHAWHDVDLAQPHTLTYTGAIVAATERANAKYERAVAFFESGRYEEALAAYTEALEIVRQQPGGWRAVGALLFNIGLVYYEQGQYAAALDYYQPALDIAQEVGDRPGEGSVLNGIGKVYRAQGQYAQALDHFAQVLAIRQEIGDRSGEGTTLSNIGAVYEAQGQYAQALDYYQQALAIHQGIGDRSAEGTTLNNIGVVYEAQGQYAQALDYYQQALAIHQEISNRSGEGTTLNNIGAVYEAQGQYAQALDYFEQALAIVQEVGNRANEGSSLNNIAGVYQAQGQYAQALDYYQQALTIRQEIGDRSGEGTSLNNIASVYHAQGQYAQALNHYEQALAIAQEVGASPLEGSTLLNIGRVYYHQGQYAQALDYFEQALTIRQEIGDRSGEGATLNNIGAVYRAQGQYAQALDYFEQALTIRQEVGDRSGEGATLSNIGVVYRAQGQYAVALVYYQQALAIHQEVGNRSGEGTTLSNIASVYRDRGQYADALDYFEQALAIFQEIGDRSGEGTALNNTGGVYDLQGQYAEALDHYQQALAISRGIGDLSGEWAALASIGSAYDLQGQVEEAVEYYTQGVAVVETIHADIRAESGQTAFFAERVWPYDRLVALLAAADPTQAFLFAERGRARTFLYQLGNERLRFGEGADAALLEEWQTQTGEIEALHARHVEVSSQPLPSSEALHDLSVQIEALEAERADLEARITRQNLALAQFTRVNLPEVAAIQAAIPGDTTMLTYYVAPALSSLDYEGEVFAFVVTQEDLQVVALPVTPNELTTAIAAFRLDESAQGEQLRSLYDWLIAPLTGQLTTSHLVLAPHDVLNYLPFAALSSESGHVLADDFTIAYTPSATVYTVLQQTRPTPQREVALVLGNPAAGLRDLPHAAAEATIVADLLGTTALLEETATESAFRAGLGTATVIHLAAHGVFDVRQPLSSYVALAPDADHDGRLEVREVYALPLGAAPLVVLSACQTAVGELTAGDEFQGLTRAFLLNGARGVVASLWSVDDAATTALMVAFHENRLAGMSDAEALAAAQRAVREHEAHPEWALPYYWAAFVLVGPGEVR